jgi:hypothetical protein
MRLIGEAGRDSKTSKIGMRRLLRKLKQTLKPKDPLERFESVAKGIDTSTPQSSLANAHAFSQIRKSSVAKFLMGCGGHTAQVRESAIGLSDSP